MSVGYDPYINFKPIIDGNYGPYDKNTAIGRSANAGLNASNYVSQSILNNDTFAIQNKSIQYTTIDKKTGKLSIDGVLAYAVNSMALFINPRQRPDIKSKVPINEKDDEIIKIAASLDGDPTSLSVAENAALSMYEDCVGVLDGIIAPEDIKHASNVAKSHPDYATDSMKKLYSGNNLEQRANELNLPQISK